MFPSSLLQRRARILSLIPITPSLYLLSDPSTSLQYVVHHALERVNRATQEAGEKFPDEFRILEPLLGPAFVQETELAFERGLEEGTKDGLWRFLMWASGRMAVESKRHIISYEACVADVVSR